MQKFWNILFSIFKFTVNFILSVVLVIAIGEVLVIVSHQPYAAAGMVVLGLPVLAISFIALQLVVEKFKARYWLTLFLLTLSIFGLTYLLALMAQQYGFGV